MPPLGLGRPHARQLISRRTATVGLDDAYLLRYALHRQGTVSRQEQNLNTVLLQLAHHGGSFPGRTSSCKSKCASVCQPSARSSASTTCCCTLASPDNSASVYWGEPNRNLRSVPEASLTRPSSPLPGQFPNGFYVVTTEACP